MILISNVKVTNTPLYKIQNRGKLSTFDRLDIWKYSLSSYVPVLPLISKVILYIDLAEFAPQQEAIEKYIKSLFPEDKLILRWNRNVTTADWRRASEEDIFPISDEIILNMMNDDHLFIDRNLDVLSALLEHLKKCHDPYAQIMYTHWPEFIRQAGNAKATPLADRSGFVKNGRSIQSLDIMKIARWRHYWFDHDMGESKQCFRPDEGLRDSNILPGGNTQFIPIRELVRHFDGYEHAGNFLNTSPPLEIPQGYFENNIKIAYGYPEIQPGYVNINPDYPNLKAHDAGGVDYKFALEDIPLAWRDRISETKINPNCDIENLKKHRDDNMYNIAVSSVRQPFPKELFVDQFISKSYNESN